MVATKKLRKIKGVISKIIYSQNDFTVGIIYDPVSNMETKFVGKINVAKDDRIILEGYDHTDKKYGKRFNVETFSHDFDLDEDGLIKYLADNKTLTGVGPAKAQKIVSACNKHGGFAAVVEGDLNTFIKISKLKDEIATQFRLEWIEKKQYSAIATKLLGWGLSHSNVDKLIDKYGNNVLNILKENPYRLIGEVAGFAFKKCDAIALKTGVSKESPDRIKACLKYLVTENEDFGHCFLYREDLIYKANKYLIMDCLNSQEIISNHLDFLVRDKQLVEVSYKDSTLVANKEIYDKELFLYNCFTNNLSENPHVSEFPEKLWGEAPFASLNEDQRKVLNLFCKTNQMVLAGIAGAGKSFTLDCITKFCKRNKLSFVLTSFTGKACKVLEDITGETASTLHRLLGYTGAKFTFRDPTIRNADVIIIDEVGLIDIRLLATLYSQLDLSRQVVVLAGDYNQLPPVGIGNILKGLTTYDILPKIILTKCVRQAGELKLNSSKILEGEVAPTSPDFIGNTTRKAWYKINNFSKAEDIRDYLTQIYQGSLQEKLGFNLVKDIQLLTPTHKGDLGTVELNKVLQRTIQEKVYNADIVANQKFYVHDKVIQTRNNYDLDVMNGDIGFISAFKSNNHLWVQFGEKIVEYKDSDVFDLELAYAITIHKCLVPDTIVETDKGLYKIKDIETFGNINTSEGMLPYINKVHNNVKLPCIKITTKDGYSLTGTEDHKLKVFKNGIECDEELNNIGVGDIVRLKIGQGEYTNTFLCPLISIEKDNIRERAYTTPLYLNEECAELLGMLVSDGTIYGRGFRLAKRHIDVVDRFEQLCVSLFGVNNVKRFKCSNSEAFVCEINSTYLCRWLMTNFNGLLPNDKDIPDKVLKSNTGIQRSFLRGLFEDGTVNIKDGLFDHIEFATVYESLSNKLKVLLLRLGIVTGYYNKVQQNCISYHLYIYKGFVTEFKKIGFISNFKNNRLVDVEDTYNSKYVVYLTDFIISSLERYKKEIIDATYKGIFNKIKQRRKISKDTIRKIIHVLPESYIKDILQDTLTWHYTHIKKVEYLESETYCVEVPGHNRFLQNGFEGSNCQGSGLPCVIVIIHKSHSWMHSRSLLYTGVTRAKQTAIIIGDTWGINNCLSRVETDTRRTFLEVFYNDNSQKV